jgi:hypothetical protein
VDKVRAKGFLSTDENKYWVLCLEIIKFCLIIGLVDCGQLGKRLKLCPFAK